MRYSVSDTDKRIFDGLFPPGDHAANDLECVITVITQGKYFQKVTETPDVACRRVDGVQARTARRGQTKKAVRQGLPFVRIVIGVVDPAGFEPTTIRL